jgi:hypothetical protein
MARMRAGTVHVPRRTTPDISARKFFGLRFEFRRKGRTLSRGRGAGHVNPRRNGRSREIPHQVAQRIGGRRAIRQLHAALVFRQRQAIVGKMLGQVLDDFLARGWGNVFFHGVTG